MQPPSLRRSLVPGSIALVALALAACDDNNNGGTGPTETTLFQETPIVADASGSGATIVDAHLKNPWGIAVNPSNGIIWVANNHDGTSTVYQPDGTVVPLVVTVPSATGPTGGAPTGIVFNPSTDFVIPNQGAALFLFASEDGTISAWNQATGTSAVVVANRSGNDASYTGLALIGSTLFAANFKGKTVDIFDQNFGFVKSVTDPDIPSDYGPFNVQAIGTSLYVAYAKVDPVSGDEVAGVGNGYVSVFSSTGDFVKRFASQGTLNAPWAVVTAPSTFGPLAGAILVGNFGDGLINAFDASSGNFLGQLKSSSSAQIQADGLWGLAIGSDNTLLFAAGIADEEHGLLGKVAIK